ncbi:MAG: protein-L-isoaspartate(D-aspartate) O-methyltransferase [Gammaproteobacteria bacterium]|jgi:protein-L-isoaspartate(D-aspartate) O-methyltransferase
MKHRFAAWAALLLAGCIAAPLSHARDGDYARERARMVDTIVEHVRETSDYLGRGKLDPKVIEAMSTVPRHQFVPARLRERAYDNRPLPIGHSQTISQPYIVAIMTDLLGLDPNDQVLEIGTGSGYQAAILASLVDEVYTIEIIEPLGESARQRLRRLGFDGVHVRIGDGYYGWPEHAPFDAIVVTAAASHIPPPLIEQLKPGGRMVIPVGSHFMTQQLLLVTKSEEGQVRTRQLLPVAFVPLTGGH